MQDRTVSFGYWLRRKRKALDLTQEALAQRVFCSGFTIRKIEADERRPSRALAERLCSALAIPEEEQPAFLDAARAQHTTRQLRINPVPLDITESSNDSVRTFEKGHVDGLRTSIDNSPFVGRNKELELLIGLTDRLISGNGYTVMVEGEAGIGKSRLLREVTHYSRSHNLPTLVTNCYEIERAIPYQPIVDLVTHALAHLSKPQLQNLPAVSLAELAALVPEIADNFTKLPTLSNDFPEARQARLCRAVDQLLEAFRDKYPMIVMVDDIQWVDDASAQVLHYLARHSVQRPLLCIYAYRDEAIDSDEQFGQLVHGIYRDSGAQHIKLNRLKFTDTETLVSTLSNDNVATSDLSKRLHAETDGNPFFIISMLQSLNEGEIQFNSPDCETAGLIPNAIHNAVRTRILHVPKLLRSLLDNAAVLGRRFDFDTLLDVTKISETQLLDDLDDLVRRRLLREESQVGYYDFSHDKVREVVYRDISAARRRSLHRSVAETLENRNEHDSQELDARLAEHYERAQLWKKALHYQLLAAEHSQKLFSMRDALHWLDRAVALCEAYPESFSPKQCLSVYQYRGLARAQAGQTQGAVADIRRSIDELRADGDRTKTRDMLIQLGMAYRRADLYDKATACLTEALRESRLMKDEHHAADTLYHLGTVAWSTGKNNQAITYHQQAVEICERMGYTDLVAVQAFHGRGEAHFADAEPAAAIEYYTRSLQLARGIGDKSYESENLMMIGHACIGARGHGDYPKAAANFEAALEIARSADLQWHFGPILIGLDHVLACTGNYGQAWLGIQKTLPWLESLNQVRYQFIAIDCIGHLLLDLGLNELAIEQMQRGSALSIKTGILFWCAAIETHLAIAQCRSGKKVDTKALQTTLEKTRRSSERYMMTRCLDGLAEIALTEGDIIQCLKYADELLEIAKANNLMELEAVALRWRGEAMMAQNDFLAAQSELTHAYKIAEQIGRIRLQFDTQVALTRIFTAQNRPSDAQTHRIQAGKLQHIIEKSLQSSGLKAQININVLATQ